MLVVTVIIAILAGLLLPALASAKDQARRSGCLNHLKQLALGSQLYAADNDGKLVENLPARVAASAWVAGNMKVAPDATNTLCLRQGKLFPYVSQTSVYRCLSDQSQLGGLPRVRSYAMNGWMGSRFMQSQNRGSDFRTFLRESELAASRPAALWMVQDEHPASLDDGWFLVTMDDSQPFASCPAARHGRGYGVNFADGHAEVIPLRDPASPIVETASAISRVSSKNVDWLRLKEITTTK